MTRGARCLATLASVAWGFLPATAGAVVPAGLEKFGCGRYSLTGRLHVSATGVDTLVMYPDTEREYPFLLRAFPDTEMLLRHGTLVTLEIEVTRPGQGASASGRFLKFVETALRETARSAAVRKLADAPCAKP